MPISREKKEALVAEYTEHLRRSQAVYLTDYRGLRVEEMGELRAKLREAATDSRLTVAKNTLLKLALEQAHLPPLDGVLQGPTAILFAYDDPVAPIKVLKEYADAPEGRDKLTLKGGLLGETVLDIEGLSRIAELPSRDELLATLVASIQAPARQLVTLLQAPQRELILTLRARAEQTE